MRKGTLITVIVLFALLLGAAIYQFTLGTRDAPRFCGPPSPGALPTPGVCSTGSP
ncbi:MAG TPA: hypothetical protein VGB19_08490 [Actinomycetota bacterium]